MKLKCLLRSGVVLTTMLCASRPARADSFGFTCLTDNGVYCTNGSLTGVTLWMTVTAGPNPNQALFTFFNHPSSASASIEDIYFADGTLLEIAQIIDSPPDVDFFEDLSPPKLAGGGAFPYESTHSFSTDAANPAPNKGVNPGEQLQILFTLSNSYTFQDTIAALAPATGDPTLRIGIHLIGLPDGSSETLVNDGGGGSQGLIPEPASVILLGSTLLTISHLMRKRFPA